MSNYQPYEGSQGDPWSTEPVQEPSRGRRDQSAESYYDQSPEVLARMPDVAGEGRGDSDRHSRRHSHGHGSHRRGSRSSGLPASVWAFGGLVLLAVALVPFFLKRESKNETALEEPSVWQQEPPAPNAPLAPAWSAGADSQWRQAGAWPQDPATPATVNAEPGVPGTWNASPPTADWIGAPAGAPYAANAADPRAQGGNPATYTGAEQTLPAMNPPLAPGNSPPAWNNAATSNAAPVAASRDYPAAAETGTPYPAAPNSAAPNAAAYGGASPYGPSATVSQTPNWSQPAANPPLVVPQPEAASPAYGGYPAPAAGDNHGEPLSTNVNTPQMNYGVRQANPYVSQPATRHQSGPIAQYPTTTTPPAGGQPITAVPYGQVSGLSAAAGPAEPAMARRDVYTTGQMPAGMTPPANETVPPSLTPWGASAYPTPAFQQPAAAAPAYPTPNFAPAGDPRYAAPAANPNRSPYPTTVTYPYTQPAIPAGQPPTQAAPAGQPNYGSGAALPSQSSAARLSGVIQEPNTRAAYDDRARPSFY